MDEDTIARHFDKVERWRLDELERMFPEMPVEQREELALGNDRFLLEKAERLRRDGCPVELAYRIMR